MKWIGHINRMDSKIKVSQVFNINHQKWNERTTKQQIVEMCANVYALIAKSGQKSYLTRRSPLKRRKPAIDLNAIKEEE